MELLHAASFLHPFGTCGLLLMALGVGSVIAHAPRTDASRSAALGVVATSSVPRQSGFSGAVNVVLGDKVAALLPSANQQAQIMEVGSRLAVVELSNRVLTAGGNAEVLRDVIASMNKAAPSYDPRLGSLGITREEFQRYVAFQPDLTATNRSVRLTVQRNKNALVIGDLSGEAGILRGLSFDLKSGELRVPEGFVARPVQLYPTRAGDRSVDIQGGFKWDLSFYSAETQNGIRGQLSLYQLSDNYVVLIYKRFSMLKGRTNDGQVVLKYKVQ